MVKKTSDLFKTNVPYCHEASGGRYIQKDRFSTFAEYIRKKK
jgi:hypothetical protein